jgi:TonB family protein
MRNFELWILAYLVNSLWQVPLLFAAAWVASLALRSLGARVEHRLWVCALVLQSTVPAFSTVPWAWLGKFFWNRNAGTTGEGHVSILMGTGFAAPAAQGALQLTITLLYTAVTGYFAARFVWRAVNLSVLRREAVPLQLAAEAAQFWARCSRIFEVREASIAASSRVSGPVTMGTRRKLLLLPVSVVDILAKTDFETVIAHEFAHMCRQDFLKNLLYELLSLPVSFHPLLWVTRARIMESREMVCDQIAAQMTGGSEYARSLLRLASLLISAGAGRTPHTIGIFDANVFERRLMNLTEKSRQVQGVWRVALLAVCAALGLATCASAVALGTHVDATPVTTDNNASKAPARLSISAEEMSGNLLTKSMPIYPPEAKKNKIQGKVVLNAVIGTDGRMESVRVLSGPDELQQSALDAVRQWTYKPYLLNGQPVEGRRS